MSGLDRASLLEAPARFEHDFLVPFQHIDAAGIVFFARVLDYFHDTYVGYLAHCGHPLPEVLRSRAWAAPLVHAEADYMAPLRFGDSARCAIVATQASGSKITVGYRLMNGAAPAAVGHTVHVFVDPRTMKRCDPPADLIARFVAP